MTTNCIEQIGEGVFVTNLFWTCSCKEDFLCINGLGKCPLCNMKEADGAPADISTVLKHAAELDKNRVKALISAMTTSNENLCLEDMLLAIAKDNGFHESDDTGVLYVLTIADAANTLMRMMDEGEICLQELTGDHFQNMLQHIANDISFDWDEEIRWRIRSWKEIKDKEEAAEETEGFAEKLWPKSISLYSTMPTRNPGTDVR